jgi:hypothetical protein
MTKFKAKLTLEETIERKKAANKKYRQNNREKILNIQRNYRLNNPEFVASDNLKRKLRRDRQNKLNKALKNSEDYLQQ